MKIYSYHIFNDFYNENEIFKFNIIAESIQTEHLHCKCGSKQQWYNFKFTMWYTMKTLYYKYIVVVIVYVLLIIKVKIVVIISGLNNNVIHLSY